MSAKNAQPNGLEFPYTAPSPTTGAQILYTEDELWCEIDRILAEDDGNKFTIGQQCYFNLILGCCNPDYFLNYEITTTLEEYMMMKRFNIPLASDIDSAIYNRLVTFASIDDEYNALMKLKQSNG